jgi:hypothetical protein
MVCTICDDFLAKSPKKKVQLKQRTMKIDEIYFTFPLTHSAQNTLKVPIGFKDILRIAIQQGKIQLYIHTDSSGTFRLTISFNYQVLLN